MSRIRVDNSTAEEHSGKRIGPAMHRGENDGRIVPLMHADGINVSAEALSEDWNKVEESFVSLALFYGDAGLYVSLDEKHIDKLIEALRASKAQVQAFKENGHLPERTEGVKEYEFEEEDLAI